MGPVGGGCRRSIDTIGNADQSDGFGNGQGGVLASVAGEGRSPREESTGFDSDRSSALVVTIRRIVLGPSRLVSAALGLVGLAGYAGRRLVRGIES
jgi:hypothetical protein